jgi:hypothetical protein
MAEWMSIQQNSTQYCVKQRTMISNAALNYNEGKGGFASKPTLLKALKRTLQEMLGIDRWYGTMPIVCMIAWIMQKATDIEELIAAMDHGYSNETKKTERKEKRKKTKERAEKKGKERGTTPTQ